MNYLTIGKVAKKSNIGIETIRYYERIGIIPNPPRTESGYRSYPEDTVSRIIFIKRAQELGFSLKEIKELLSLRIQKKGKCKNVKNQAIRKLKEIDSKIRTLQKIKKVLTKLVESCDQQKNTSVCPILDALTQEDKKNE